MTKFVTEELDAKLIEFCRAVPKAELHVHIEGTLEPQLMFELAGRNQVTLAFQSVEEAIAARKFGCLVDFLKMYYSGCDALRTEKDFHALMTAYLTRAAEDGVVHAEIFFDPQSHLVRGVTWSTMLDGMLSAMTAAKQSLGITSSLIMCFLRHLGVEAAMDTLDALLASHRDAIVGVGLDSNEIFDTPEPWKPVFEKASAAGLRLCSHAGEEETAQYVRDVIDILKVERVDHGVKSVNDAALLVELAASQIPLTVCPLSNVHLKVFDGVYEDKLRMLLSSGACVTLNSDDPAYFVRLDDPSKGAYAAYNYEFAARVGGLDASQVAALACNSIRGSWLDPEEKERHLAAIAALLDSYTAKASEPTVPQVTATTELA